MPRKTRAGAEPAKKPRLTFGVDRLPEDERTTPAWPTATSIEAKREARFKKFLNPHPAPIGAADRKLPTREQKDARLKTWAKGVTKTPEYRKALEEGRIRFKEPPGGDASPD